jgi:hypothetical protein
MMPGMQVASIAQYK